MKSFNINSYTSLISSAMLEGKVKTKKGVVFYDTIIGVGDSITDGEFKVSGRFEHKGELTPFRGVTLDSAAVPGTTLQYMIDNVSLFTNLSKGKTLFVVRAGINDLNTYMTPDGLEDGATGDILSWSELTETQRNLSESRYRELIALLEPFGDVALASVTYADAKGQLSVLPDKGVSTHSGSWNDNLVIPLCKELTPKFYDHTTDRPVFDYYKATLENLTALDVDNLHYYHDRDYFAQDAGYPDGLGSYILCKTLTDTLSKTKAIPSKPFENKFTDRLKINLSNEVGRNNRPFFNREGNNIALSTLQGSESNLSTYERESSDIAFSWEASNNFLFRLNNNTSSLPYTEDVCDRNALSSGVFIHEDRTFNIKLTNVGKGVLSLVGIYDTTADNLTGLTKVTISDDLGQRSVEFNNYFDNSAGNFDRDNNIGVIEYDCSVSKEITITVEASGSSSYGGVSSLMLDMK